MAQIDQKYFWESILYTYILHHVINYDKLQEFRGSYLKWLENNDVDQSTETIKAFKDNLNFFLLEEYQYIDTTPFVSILDQLEKYYQEIMPDEFHSFRRYQYSSLFFSYIFFVLHKDKYFKENYLNYIDQEILVKSWEINLDSLVEFNFNRLGYWMATWCGKTLLMYAVVYMYCKLFAPTTKTLYVIVPSDELRKQHKEFIRQFAQSWLAPIKDWVIVEFSNIPLFGDYEVSGKLTTISWIKDAQLSSDSVLLMDEAHKWASNEAWAIETLKNKYILQNNTMLFEFSATFQEAFKSEEKIDSKENIFDYYHFSSLYKYNLFDFNADGFGKDYIVQAVKKTAEDEVTDKRKLVCSALINFALQLRWYEHLEKFTQTWAERTQYIKKETYLERTNDGLRVYKPLFLWLSWKLDSEATTKDGKESETTLTAILRNFAYIFTHLDEFEEQIISSQIEVSEFYKLLTWNEYSKWASIGLQIRYDKQSDEIKLWLGKSIMLINTWQNAKIAEKLKDDPQLSTAFSYQDLLKSERLFNKVDKDENILFLFWSKKFIEWWDSKRPSTILLFKMWWSSTVIATQILGRWLRLYWINGDGYRHLNYSTKSITNSKIRPLEQICMFWYDIDEFEKFIEALAGDQYRVAIIKKREYAKTFRDFLEANNINITDDSMVSKFFRKKFPVLDETLDEWEEENIQVEILDIKLIAGKLHFVYKDKEKNIDKTMWVLKWQYKILSEVTRKKLEGGKVEVDQVVTWDIYNKTYNEVFGSENILPLVKKIVWSQKTFSITDIQVVSDYIGNTVIETDKFSKALENAEHLFDITSQNKIMDFFIDYLYQLFNSVWNRIRNYKFKSINTATSSLKITNLIDELRLEFTLKKKEDKELINLFFWDSAKFTMEKNYEDLNQEQQKIVKNMFIQKRYDLHLYERLYYLPNKREKQYTHDLDDADVVVRTPVFSPFELNINKNEEEKIENMLERLNKNKDIISKYDIFYLRNLVGKKGVWLKYENIDWEFANFYSDFLVWFINKSDDSDVTIVYLEPKGDGIDKNREKKKEKLLEITSIDVDSDIQNIFWENTAWKNKYSWFKVLWVMQMEF